MTTGIITAALLFLSTVGALGYVFFGRGKQLAAQAAEAALDAAAAAKLAAYLKYCADHDLKPYADVALVKQMLG